MKREARLLLNKALDSLTLSIEFFNRPQDKGRSTATLILLDHSFEMLLKSAILHRNGRIWHKRGNNSIGFDECVRVGLSNGDVKFLTDEQVLLLQTINNLRDAAQHYLLDISEGQLYIHAQAGVTLFRDILKDVFSGDLCHELPNRVLPLATSAPTDLIALFESEVEEIRKLLSPGSRKRTEAIARLQPLLILDQSLLGSKGQPDRSHLNNIVKKLSKKISWAEIFEGVASVQITANGTGPTIELRLTKNEGAPIQIVPEGTPRASVVAVKRVNELGFYNLGLRQISNKIEMSDQKTLALIRYCKLQDNPEYFKIITIGSQSHKRYSQAALAELRRILSEESPDMNAVWAEFGAHKRAKAK